MSKSRRPSSTKELHEKIEKLQTHSIINSVFLCLAWVTFLTYLVLQT